MKKLTFVLFLNLCALWATISNAKTDRDLSELVGNVRTAVSKSCGGEKGLKILEMTTIFDHKGNLTESVLTSYRVDGAADGRKLKSIYKFNPGGNSREVISSWEDGVIESKSVHIYDSIGNRTGIIRYNPLGSLQSMSISIFDSRGNNTQGITYGPTGTILSRAVYVYDDKGHISESTFYKEDGSVDAKIHHTYDAKGNRTETLSYKADGSLDYKRTYIYDQLGNVAEERSFQPDGSLQSRKTYEYKYDSVGNWTMQNISEWDGKPGELKPEKSISTCRTITYWGKK